jgi:hypothetical protein
MGGSAVHQANIGKYPPQHPANGPATDKGRQMRPNTHCFWATIAFLGVISLAATAFAQKPGGISAKR